MGRRKREALDWCEICDGHHGPGQHPEDESVELSIIRCGGCGRLGVALNNTRITGHKCAGAWAFVHKEKVSASRIRSVILSKKDGNQ